MCVFNKELLTRDQPSNQSLSLNQAVIQARNIGIRTIYQFHIKINIENDPDRIVSAVELRL